jgi:NEDD4-binding protein 2
MRSLPGGGKSTLAKELAIKHNGVIHSTDEYHMRYITGQYPNNGVWKYIFQPDKLHQYHKQNIAAATNAMCCGANAVIIDNTNIKFEEMKPYILSAFLFDYEVEMVEPDTPWRYDAEECSKRNTHGVPLKNLISMQQRWQHTDECMKKMNELKELIRRFR